MYNVYIILQANYLRGGKSIPRGPPEINPVEYMYVA